MYEKEMNPGNAELTNEELQWTINEALDNAIKVINNELDMDIKTVEFAGKIDRLFKPENPGPGPFVTEAVICHLKNLIHIQQSRAEKKHE